MSKPNTVALMFSILAWVRGRGGASVAEIANHFSVDASQVRAAVRMLGEASFGNDMPDENIGLDWDQFIESDYVSVQDMNRVSDTLGLSDSETIAFVTGLIYLSHMLPPDLKDDASSAALKLLAARGLDIDFTKLQAFEDETVSNRRELLQQAISTGKQAKFEYVSGVGETTGREITPKNLRQVGRHWLVEAIDLQDGVRKSFRLDRMSGLTVVELDEAEPAQSDGSARASGAEVWAVIDEAARGFAEGNAQIRRYKQLRAVYEVFDEHWMQTQMLLIAPWIKETNREDILAAAKARAHRAGANRDLILANLSA